MMLRAACLATLLTCGGSALALTLDLPAGAELTREITVEQGARGVPIGVSGGEVEKHLAQGSISIRAFRVNASPNTAAIIAPLEASLAAAGFETELACETQSCGGFDFRFALELIPPPNMFVDLSDFRFLSARASGGDAYVSIVASRSQNDGYLHVTQILAMEQDDGEQIAGPVSVAPAPALQTDFGAALEQDGHRILPDVVFESGSTELREPSYPSLEALADYLIENPDRTVALVGHTDATGSLEGNIEISRARARATMERLISTYGISPAQVRAEGMGYLAPRATNLTEEGREKNRRVEVILTSTRP